MMIADNGSSWYISGAPDDRWNNDDLHKLTTITGAAFEVVDVAPLMIDPNSGKAAQNSVSVSVTPPSANVALNATQQFSASVLNSGDQTVNWGVNGVIGGNSVVGWISAAGFYTAPNVPPSPATVMVQATSQSTPSAVGTSAVTITNPAPPPVTVTVSPASASVRIGRTQQFSATVQNSTNQSVTWQVNGVTGGNSKVGTVTAKGLYTAPASVPSSSTVTVTAVSVAQPAASGSASVTIRRK
jgi:uncharacterized protein YjdB